MRFGRVQRTLPPGLGRDSQPGLSTCSASAAASAFRTVRHKDLTKGDWPRAPSVEESRLLTRKRLADPGSGVKRFLKFFARGRGSCK